MRPSCALVLLAVSGCGAKAPESAQTDVASIRQTIEAMDKAQERWIANEALDSTLTQYYAPDAVFLTANQPAAKGTEEIRKLLSGFMGTGKFHFHINTVSVEAADSVASEYGTYTLEIRAKAPADTTKVVATDRGNYVTTFVRRSGQWRAVYDISLSDVPVPPPSASTKR
jgi:ketosteroid isomerase-like protein